MSVDRIALMKEASTRGHMIRTSLENSRFNEKKSRRKEIEERKKIAQNRLGDKQKSPIEKAKSLKDKILSFNDNIKNLFVDLNFFFKENFPNDYKSSKCTLDYNLVEKAQIYFMASNAEVEKNIEPEINIDSSEFEDPYLFYGFASAYLLQKANEDKKLPEEDLAKLSIKVKSILDGQRKDISLKKAICPHSIDLPLENFSQYTLKILREALKKSREERSEKQLDRRKNPDVTTFTV